MGRWAATTFRLLFRQHKHKHKHKTCLIKPLCFSSFSSTPTSRFLLPRQLQLPFSYPYSYSYSYSYSAVANQDYFDYTAPTFIDNNNNDNDDDDDDEDLHLTAKIPVKAFFLSTSINLRSMQTENSGNVIPPTSRNSNYITLRFSQNRPEAIGIGLTDHVIFHRYMVVFHYGSAVLFNVDDHEVDFFLNIARKHSSGVLREMKKDDYTVKEKPTLVEDMQGGADYIVLKHLDTDAIRIIGSVLGQSIALDYFVSQVDLMVKEFADINRGMENTGTFTMHRKKLFQLVGKANSNLADVILKVGLFDRSEIAWREAKYAQINEYLREEYEVTARFGNLDIKLKFIEHNIHFLQEVLQNRRSDLLEWCIIVLLTIENVIGIFEIIKDSMSGSI